MMEKKYDLEDRLVNFASNIALLCKGMPSDMIGEYYGNQLLRSGGSAALNFGEAQGSITTRDKIHKLSLSLKELKETRVSIKILDKLNYCNPQDRKQLIDEGEQLIRIIATIIKTQRSRLDS